MNNLIKQLTNAQEITSESQLRRVLSTSSPVYFDTETQGLYGEIALVQMNINNKLYYLYPFKVSKFLKILKEIDPYIIGINIAYDFNSLKWIPSKWEDLQWAARIQYPEFQKYSLDILITKFIGYNPYSLLQVDKKKMQKFEKWKAGEEVSISQLYYALLDVLYLPYIHKKVAPAFKVKAYILDKKVQDIIMDVQDNKILVDKKNLLKEITILKNEIKKLEEEKIELAGEDFNIRSYQQVREVLGTTESSKAFLTNLVSQGNRLAEIILKLRTLYKQLQILESYNTPEGWVQTIFKVYGTITGRFSATGDGIKNGINAQQIPRQYQYLFQHNTEDTVALHLDYSTAEVRAAAAIYPDVTLAQYLKEGVDIHKASAQLITNKPLDQITKKERQNAKAVTFGFLFGMSAPTFVEYAFVNYGVKFTLEEATQIRKRFLTKYKGVNNWVNYWWGHWEKEYPTSPLGRKIKPKIGTEAINFPIQSAIGETTKLALIALVKRDPIYRKYVFNIIHDAIDLRIPKEEIEQRVPEVVDAMLEAWEYINNYPAFKIKTIPMGVEYAYVNSKGNKITKEIFRSPKLKE